ncbi:MAG: hypothetical protein KatS3mg035_2194 [Bacteroidia bacterium]|nr:MAG: hypothetical protein KatS3mg035_2194 [Bacteroidia bacterium]
MQLSYSPPLPEQQAIARVLSDVDELIESLSKLIEKKKNIKKGAMQELLTGKRRLPGFGVGRGYKQTELGVIPEDWEVKKLGDLGDLYAGGTPSTSNPLYWNGPIIWLQSGRIQNNVIKKLDNEITITEEGLKNSAAKLIRKNSVLIAITGATCGNVAFLPFEATANQSVVSVVTNHNNIAKFLYHKLLSERPKILQLQNGSAQGGVNLNSLKKIQLFTPPLPEQQAIARVLSDMDEEIEALEKKKAKYENLKKAMMQVLLTGKIRLKNFAKV